MALPELRTAAAVHGPLTLVQFDAHPDTWDTYFGQKHTHGTPFRRAVEEGLLRPENSIQVGMALHDKWSRRRIGGVVEPERAVRE